MHKKLFGTDGIRGVAGRYPLDSKTIIRTAQAAALELKNTTPSRLVLLGRDTRRSGKNISQALIKGFLSCGIDAWDLGVIPTPGVAWLARKYPVMAGVVISASHNPYRDNGIKFFSHNGTKLSDSVESLIEQRIVSDKPLAAGLSGGKAKTLFTPAEYYENMLCLSAARSGLAGLKIVLDCANGACSNIAPSLFSGLGARVWVINASPSGVNINLNSGSLHPEKLSAEVRRRKADIGIAFDGDGDRAMFVDETGVVRDGDYILALLALHFKRLGKLRKNTLVTTVMANLGLVRCMAASGIKLVTTSVGDRYVFEGMLSSGAVLGGEQSGHLIFSELLPTGDGMQSALQVLSVMKETGQKLSKLTSVMKKYPQILINTFVDAKIPLEKLPETSRSIKAFEKKLGGEGRVLVRYSGTENLIRVMIEGRDKKEIKSMARAISDTAKKEIAGR